jgi:hypothetical protein
MGQKKGLFKYHKKEVRNWDREAHLSFNPCFCRKKQGFFAPKNAVQ